MAFGCCAYLKVTVNRVEGSNFSMASPNQAKKSDLNNSKKV